MATNEELLKKIELLEKRVKAYEQGERQVTEKDTEYLKNYYEDTLKAQQATDALIKSKAKLNILEAKSAADVGDTTQELKKYTDALSEYEKLMGDAAQKTSGLSEEERKRKAAALEALGIDEQTLQVLREKKRQLLELDPLFVSGEKKGKKYGQAFSSIANKVLPIYNERATKLYNGFKDFLRNAKDPKAMAGMIKGFKSIVNVQNAMLAVTSKVVSETFKLAAATDQAVASFAAATGAGRSMSGVIMNSAAGFRNLGLDAEKTGKAVTDLYNNFTDFTLLSKQAQTELAATVAMLGRLGIDGQTASKALTLFNKNMGMSIKDSQKFTKQLAMMGVEMGISSEKMVKGFTAASKSLAVYGKDAVKIFGDIAAMAKKANVEMDTLLGLAGKFDTFEGAADMAGKLNSILGTQLSATEMLTMKENERIETLIRSIQAQGIAFKDLDRFSQKAIASAAGISDMAEAQRIFSMSVGDFRRGLKGDAAEEKFNQALKDTMAIVEKLKRIGQTFAISLAPVLNGIAKIAQGLLDINQRMEGKLIPVLFSIIAAVKILPMVVGLFKPLIALFSTGAATKSAVGLKTFSTTLAASSKNLAKGSLGLLAMGAAFVVFAYGMSMIIKAFGSDMSGGSIIAILGGLSVGIISLAGALSIVAAVASTGIGTAGMLIAIGILAAAVAAMGYAFAATMGMIDQEKLIALGQLFNGLGNLMVNFKMDAFTDTSKFLESLNEIDAEVKPVLGDLALIATGKTTQDLTTNTTDYNFNTFAADFKNIFKPTVVVKIGDKELKQIISETSTRE